MSHTSHTRHTDTGSRADHRGRAAVQRLVELLPSGGALALWMQHRDVDRLPVEHERDTTVFADSVIGNDGLTIYYTPRFSTRPLPRQCADVLHQVLHVALRHAPRRLALETIQGSIDHELYNLAADAIVNASLAHLDWLDVDVAAPRLDRLLSDVLGQPSTLHQSLLRWDTESLYRALDDRQASGSRSGRQARSGHGAGIDKPENDSDRTALDATRMQDGPTARAARALCRPSARDLLRADSQTVDQTAEQTRLWSERLQRATASNHELSLLSVLLADRPRQRTPWQYRLRTRLQRSLAAEAALSWSRPNRAWLANRGRTASGRRMPWSPGLSGTRPVPRLAVIIDVSGSIPDALLQRFGAEIERLLRLHRADICLIIGDDRVRRVERLRPGGRQIRGLRFDGRGGTDFRPLIDAATNARPDLIIVLTDLDGPVGAAPEPPVLWAVSPDSSAPEPAYGEILRLE